MASFRFQEYVKTKLSYIFNKMQVLVDGGSIACSGVWELQVVVRCHKQALRHSMLS
jgi:hypothetical protein